MNPSALLAGYVGGSGRRFLTVVYLPIVGNVAFLLILVWAGAPGSTLRFDQAWSTAGQLEISQAIGLWLAVTLLAVTVTPLQFQLVHLLEGDWPRWMSHAARGSSWLQQRRRKSLYASSFVEDADATQTEINRAGAAWTALISRYPPMELPVAPTALGNVLTAIEHACGKRHGLDVVVVWPRLYPLLDPETKAPVDHHRDAMDAACCMSLIAVVTSLVAVVLLWQSGFWVLLALVPAVLARVAYLAAVQAAFSYGICIDASIDTQRFRLYEALHLPLPDTPSEEYTLNQGLSLHWRQRTAHPSIKYSHLIRETQLVTPHAGSAPDSAGEKG